MKKIILAIALISGTYVFAADPIANEKVRDAFHKTFSNAQDVSWSAAGASYEVQFRQNDIQSRITYDQNGNIVKTIRYYGESQLPILLLTKIKNRFADRTVFGVTEVSSDEGTFYHIVLEGKDSWQNIQADTFGTINTGRKMKKG